MEKMLINTNNTNSLFPFIIDEFFTKLPAPSSYKVKDSLNSIKVNLFKTDTEYQLEAFMPGLNKDNIKVDYNSEILNISYKEKNKKEKKDKNLIFSEYSTYNLSKSIKLKKEIDFDKSEAKYENGVLYLNLPFKVKESLKTLRIK